uniref:Aa_trans domain-containing protein n=1 Tax=Mesocestoides corti TaxID=53468 RepID=A0A5K3FTA4_MESCO
MFGRRFGAQPMPVAAVGDSDHPLNTSLSSPKVWKSPTWPFIIAGMPLCVLLVILGFLFIRLPAIPEDQRQFVKLPRNLDDLKSLGSTLSVYKGTCYWRILIAITFVYILFSPFSQNIFSLFGGVLNSLRSMQSFMIPGSVFCSVLLGFLFPIPLALFVIAFCSAVGASCCYVIANFIGSKTILKLYPEHVMSCQMMMSRFKNTMCFAIILFRLSPIIPNWLVNICSPLLGVPLLDFFLGTFIESCVILKNT